jgi:hypothetical protein
MTGPGTELKLLLSSIGINPTKECSCHDKILEMDMWGVQGCIDHRQQIIEDLRQGYLEWGWRSRLIYASKAVLTGAIFKIQWPDPFPGLVDQAIRNAAKKEYLAAAKDELDYRTSS